MTKTEKNLLDFIDTLADYIDAEDREYANWIEIEACRIVTEGDLYKEGKGYIPNG